MNGWTKAWAAWAVVAGGGFAIIERKALKHPGASLSEHTRTVFGFDNLGPMPHVRRAIFYAAWGWLGVHILRGTSGCVFRDAAPMPLS